MSTANVQATYATDHDRQPIGYPGRPDDREPRPIDTALMHAADRLDRLEHVLEGQLIGAINLLEARLEYVLTPGATDPGPTSGEAMADPSPDRPRVSTVARRITSLAERADTAADRVLAAAHRLEALAEGVEA